MKRPKLYGASHYWLRKNYGTPLICESKECKNESKTFDWALIKGKKHAKKRENYFRLCRKCHIQYDWTEERAKKLLEVGHTKAVNKKRGISRRGWIVSKETREKQGRNNRKPILQIKDGQIINRYKSATEAAKAMNKSVDAISAAATGRQEISAGFEWKYL